MTPTQIDMIAGDLRQGCADAHEATKKKFSVTGYASDSAVASLHSSAEMMRVHVGIVIGQAEHLNMTMDMFQAGGDENGVSVVMSDITLGGTKNWQSGLNAKEPVCLTAFVWLWTPLHVMQRISMAFTLKLKSFCVYTMGTYLQSHCMPMRHNLSWASTCSSKKMLSTAW